MEKKTLGQILLSKNIVNEEQVAQALLEQMVEKKFLGNILIEKGYATKEDILEALTEQKKVETVTLKSFKDIAPEKVHIIPENIARRYNLLALAEEDGKLLIAMKEPTDIIAIDTIRRLLNRPIRILKADAGELIEFIDRYYSTEADLLQTVAALKEKDEEPKHVDINQLRMASENAPIIQFVNSLLLEAIKQRATDIHLEPLENNISARFRIDGVLQKMPPPPKNSYSGVVTRLKILSDMDIGERRLPQDGRTKLKIGSKDIDIRLSTLPTIYGEKIVMRMLDRQSLVRTFETAGFDEKEEIIYKQALQKTYGMIMITGPTGSGKTTTLYSGLSHINTPEKNITTVEDPVEYELPGINQVQIKPRIGFDFADALKTFLRQDPDVIMVGEIRDLETARTAIQASLTGHLVISTLHTKDTVSTLSRFTFMGVPNYLVAEAIQLIISQRLVRKICADCKIQDAEGKDLLIKMGIDTGDKEIYKGAGCSQCNQTGYLGRVAIFEILEMSKEIKASILQGKSEEEIKEICKRDGMHFLREASIQKIFQGVTTVEEFLTKTVM